MPILRTCVLTLYFLTLGMLALYGLHRLYLVFLLRRQAGAPPARLTPLPGPGGAPGPENGSPAPAWPFVTVQLPIYNEPAVARRLIRAVAALDYPRDRFELQVLDDSTDGTTPAAAGEVERLRSEGLDIRLIHRPERTGFKAGALANGLAQARGELIAVFDADFVPDPGFLRATVPHLADPAVGMVQARWGHLNRRSSILTRVQALLLDGHFLVEQAARHAAGRFFNFNGTAGVWRRRCIEEAGGWQHDTLTEDLDLSYRAQLAGWRFVFLPRVVAPAELPGSITAFRGQQERWTKGSVQTARKLLPRLLAAPLPWPVRAEAIVHFTANFAHLLMVLLAILFFPAALLRNSHGGPAPVAADLAVLLFSTFAFWIFYAAAGAAEGRGALRALATMPALMAVGVGLSVNGARAVLHGLRGPVGTFERTPKRGSVDGDAGGLERRLKRETGQTTGGEPEPLSPPGPVPAPAGGAVPLPWIEGALALYLTVCLALALHAGLWSFLPFLVLFWAGFASMAGAMILESLRSRSAPAAG